MVLILASSGVSIFGGLPLFRFLGTSDSVLGVSDACVDSSFFSDREGDLEPFLSDWLRRVRERGGRLADEFFISFSSYSSSSSSSAPTSSSSDSSESLSSSSVESSGVPEPAETGDD